MKESEIVITEQQIHDIGRRLQILRQKISDTYNNTNQPEKFREVLVNSYYRYLGMADILAALSRNDLDDFIKGNENFVDALTKNAVEDIKS